jgi:hypothetical protein
LPDANPTGVASRWSKRITGTVNPGERGSVMRVISGWWMRSNPAGRVGLTLGGLFMAGFAGMIGYILVVIAQGH